MKAHRWSRLLALALLAACDPGNGEDDGGAPRRDAARDSGADAGQLGSCQGPPGLYVEGSCTTLAEGVRPYRARFRAWVDYAEVERFFFLPAGTQIDSTHPDHWVFPRGTRFYQTVIQGSRRVETRTLTKTGDGMGPLAWEMRVYGWNMAQDRTTEVLDGAENVLGTPHDIPSVADGDCAACHSAAADAINGFSAIQINHTFGGVTLQTLLNESLLTIPIAVADAHLPGNFTTQDALGSLHASCGNCHRHNAAGDCDPGLGCELVRFWVNVADATPEDTDTYTTAVAREAATNPDNTFECLIQPDDAEESLVLTMMMTRASTPRPDGITQMPPLGTELIDPLATRLVGTWIDSLEASAFPACPP